MGGENRAGGITQDAFGDAAEQQVREAMAPVRADHDHSGSANTNIEPWPVSTMCCSRDPKG